MIDTIRRDWHALAQTLPLDGRAFIDGRRVAARDGSVFADLSPGDGRMLAEIGACGEREVRAAIDAARRSFDAGVWASRAARTAAAGIFYNAGQMCTAASRLLVHADIYDIFMQAVVDAAAYYVPGDPLDPATTMGAIVDEPQLHKVLGYVACGRDEASLRIGGRRVREASGGLYIEPTVFERARVDARIAREEIFGPVLTTFSFDHLDEALAMANDSDYGLGASIWTSDLRTAHEASRRLRTGMVWVNCHDEGGDMNFPFGGVGQSGNGRDNSLHALEKYTEQKSTLIRLG